MDTACALSSSAWVVQFVVRSERSGHRVYDRWTVLGSHMEGGALCRFRDARRLMEHLVADGRRVLVF